MRQKKALGLLAALAIGLLAIGLICAISILVSTRFFLTKRPLETPSPIPVSPPADWKIYNNTRYGYSIKYPSPQPMVLDEQANGIKIIAGAEAKPFFIIVFDNPLRLSAKDWVEKRLAENREAADKGEIPPISVEAQREVNVNGLQGYELITFAIDHTAQEIYFARDTQVFCLRFPTSDSPSDPRAGEHYQTYLQILHTFKFTE